MVVDLVAKVMEVGYEGVAEGMMGWVEVDLVVMVVGSMAVALVVEAKVMGSVVVCLVAEVMG